MNLRAVVVGIYFLMFVSSLFSAASIPPSLLGDIAPLVLISIVMAVVGVLIALWPWQDGENIKILDEEVA